jgi:Rhodopirellula transposase DDE domain
LRKKKDPAIVPVLTELVEPVTGGDPMSSTKYCRRSLQTLSAELAELGHAAAPTTVGELLRELDYKLRVNFKRLTGAPHPDRDVQFRHLGALIEAFRVEGLPILSVDAKKKELIGLFDNDGRRWLREACDVNAHDFLSDAQCRVTPYGLYDVLAKRGHVIVSSSFNTPEFAAACVARWWARIGCHRYRAAGELLLLADAGGSNGCRPRQWKKCLQEMVADRYGLDVTVCHYPTGASKWNPVEHRLFGPISINWSGQPLSAPEVLLGFLRGTPGVAVTAEWWNEPFLKGKKVSPADMGQLELERDATCPNWNYTIKPRSLHNWN